MEAIRPTYTLVESWMSLSTDLLGKWYCVYHEIVDGQHFSRYLHPTGWKPHCHYWNSKEQAEKVFSYHAFARLPVTRMERTTMQMIREDMEDQIDRDSDNLL